VPATVGLAFNLYFFVDGYPGTLFVGRSYAPQYNYIADESSGVSWLLVAFALFITIWTSIYTEFWKVINKLLPLGHRSSMHNL
jgi:hypothetical protein